MDDPKTISLSMELFIISKETLAFYEDTESSNFATERPPTKRAAAKGANQSFMPIYWLSNRIFLLVISSDYPSLNTGLIEGLIDGGYLKIHLEPNTNLIWTSSPIS
jgi:hypothetical protein